MNGINKKEQIIEVGEKLFLEKGFPNTSVEDITNALGIAKGSFYTYFSSKEELLKEIVSRTLKNIYEELSKFSLEHKSAEESLEEFVSLNIELAKSYGPSIIISLRDFGMFLENGREKALGSTIFESIKKLIEEFLKNTIGSANEESIMYITGISLSIWIETFFFKREINKKEMAKLILDGLRRNK
ncbi:TetR/AcrR family transcriptional regulator [Caldisericum exile]|uniref:TetR family transcriptional regulator n=1 Tax=Caldisericum exile (strain DSM 21853 / NBRC 104410 / AZM16c01) TaxID=511051 RepID=A0A7U6GD49_CALEA|nr:TetR/AcrR family transcriptional regulator [Caldisericum exile]BAL80220.1 putative TetR family transcriptional regulator [Caldisericum exile AZM16c01]